MRTSPKGDRRQRFTFALSESPCGHPRRLRELAGERAGERHHDPHLFGVEVVTELMSAHHEHCLVKGGPDVQRGLNDAEVRSHLERYGRNELATEKAIPAWRRFLAQFQDVLVILLLIATGMCCSP